MNPTETPTPAPSGAPGVSLAAWDGLQLGQTAVLVEVVGFALVILLLAVIAVKVMR